MKCAISETAHMIQNIYSYCSNYLFAKKDTIIQSSQNSDGQTNPKHCAVEQDDADEQYSLGELYYDAQEYQSAVGWYKLAAEQGHAGAQFGITREGSQGYRGN